MNKNDWISWVGPGWYAPMATYSAWVYVAERDRGTNAVYFHTQDEFNRMIEREV